MTIDIEKLAIALGLKSGYYALSSAGLRQLCESYAAKVLEDKEREIAELEIQNVLYKDDELEQQIAISELQAKNSELSASINDLREALEDIAKHTPENFWQNKAAQQAISKTPAQSLQEHDNKLIEMVASAWTCDCDDCPDNIRALKGK